MIVPFLLTAAFEGTGERMVKFSSAVGELSSDLGSLTSLTGERGVVTALKVVDDPTLPELPTPAPPQDDGLDSKEDSRSTITPDSSECEWRLEFMAAPVLLLWPFLGLL